MGNWGTISPADIQRIQKAWPKWQPDTEFDAQQALMRIDDPVFWKTQRESQPMTTANTKKPAPKKQHPYQQAGVTAPPQGGAEAPQRLSPFDPSVFESMRLSRKPQNDTWRGGALNPGIRDSGFFRTEAQRMERIQQQHEGDRQEAQLIPQGPMVSPRMADPTGRIFAMLAGQRAGGGGGVPGMQDQDGAEMLAAGGQSVPGMVNPLGRMPVQPQDPWSLDHVFGGGIAPQLVQGNAPYEIPNAPQGPVGRQPVLLEPGPGKLNIQMPWQGEGSTPPFFRGPNKMNVTFPWQTPYEGPPDTGLFMPGPNKMNVDLSNAFQPGPGKVNIDGNAMGQAMQGFAQNASQAWSQPQQAPKAQVQQPTQQQPVQNQQLSPEELVEYRMLMSKPFNQMTVVEQARITALMNKRHGQQQTPYDQGSSRPDIEPALPSQRQPSNHTIPDPYNPAYYKNVNGRETWQLPNDYVTLGFSNPTEWIQLWKEQQAKQQKVIR